MMNFTKEQQAMIKASERGAELDNFFQAVSDELASLTMPVTRNHIRAACTKVLARGK
jgi:hypothetical protein